MRNRETAGRLITPKSNTIAMTMSSTSDAGSGADLPARVQTYIDALVRTCTEDRTPLVSVILFGSAVKSGFSWGVSDVDLIIVVPDDASRAMRRRLGEAVARDCMPHFPVCSARTRRLVALSSTISRRFPSRSGCTPT